MHQHSHKLVIAYNQLFKVPTVNLSKGVIETYGDQEIMAESDEASKDSDGCLQQTRSLGNIEEEYSMPVIKNGKFHNPWDTWRQPSFSGIMKLFITTKNETNLPSEEDLDEILPIFTPDIREFDRSLISGVRMLWIGHATVVAQLDGFTVMTDPVFSMRSSPIQAIGPKRIRKPPCTIEELPKVDAVVISHNHYDHLDYASVVALNQRFGENLQWFVPMGLKGWMNNAGCENVVEMTWWQEHEVQSHPGVKVACTPCQHWCKRNVSDTNEVLWSSWCILGPKNSFHFAGDTGYCCGFKQIGRKYGPFTAAAIPIGAYHPRWFMSPQHVDPQQAVDIHQDIQSKSSLGIHWGTFMLTYEPYLEPRELLKLELEKREMNPSSFVTVNHGAIKVFGASDSKTVD
ncbi:N-acyl-phosphatidylethanolamine-hydrolyzing phospholipase D-like isoform X2 [Pomacea canaliculata]|uniref:N-acyl-phosphatidylethanolamine-hydrolyzing phospholipase D-like isoform X2 n=1 Tax=Pomacea canaliculata TaxID=400727 RepID=UPI000D739F29|nr:N-acyl-phosphatidylethanolamine-hydrolyzing phospholipase D-like isoform X2 [Pomacea canaliculata]